MRKTINVSVSELTPGDIMEMNSPGASPRAIVLGVGGHHPRYPHLSLVIWGFMDEHPIDKDFKYSIDALSPLQRLDINHQTVEERFKSLDDYLKGALK